MSVLVYNDSARWLSGDFVDHPVKLSYRLESNDHDESEGARTDITAPIPPRSRSKQHVKILTPELPGDYRVHVSLVQEGYCWFDDLTPAFRATIDLHVTATVS